MHDRTWLAKLYTEERRRLFLIAWNVLRDVPAAEDAVHSAFVKLAQLVREPNEPRVYAFRAVRNAAIDVRRRKLSRKVELSLEAAAAIAAALDNNDKDFTDGFSALIERSLQRLPETTREILELHLQGELTFQEIGQMLGCPTQTIASRYRRALQQLRAKLKVKSHE